MRGEGEKRGDPSNIIRSPLENSEFLDPDRIDVANEAVVKYRKKLGKKWGYFRGQFRHVHC